eukprot:TRINITY_DN15569_c1_g1_i4.p1 TRINITY_DN15569_c1_g1~~TRINITY_DN15569_c1_g1_i4.p1  ORF type:complete len:605 (-),score=86.70 TRINITY_DN15569_c1_g1_i4:250-2064(-)
MNRKFDELVKVTKLIFPRPPDILNNILALCSEFYEDMSSRQPGKISARLHGQHALILFDFVFSLPTPSSMEELATFELSGASYRRSDIMLFASTVMVVNAESMGCELSREKSLDFKKSSFEQDGKICYLVSLLKGNGDTDIDAFMDCSVDPASICVPFTPASKTAQKKGKPTPSTPYIYTRTSQKPSSSSAASKLVIPLSLRLEQSDAYNSDDEEKEEKGEQSTEKGKGKRKEKGKVRRDHADDFGRMDAAPHPPLTPCHTTVLSEKRQIEMFPTSRNIITQFVDLDLRNSNDRSPYLVRDPLMDDPEVKKKMRDLQRSNPYDDDQPMVIECLPSGDVHLVLYLGEVALAKTIRFSNMDELRQELLILNAVQKQHGMVQLKGHLINDKGARGAYLTLITSFSGYKPLEELVYRERPVDPQEAKKDDTERCYILCQIIWLLSVLMIRLGIAHRNIKPGSFLLCEDVVNPNAVLVRMTNFGKSCWLPKQGEKMTTPLKGTYSYISPESFDGRPYDEKSESFSLGVTIFEVMSRRRVFDQVADRKLVARMHAQGMRDEFDADFPQGIKEIVELLWNQDLTKRIFIPQSLPLMRNQLTNFIIVEQRSP